MTIITKAPILKGEVSVVSLDKDSLLALVTDPDFQDPSVWEHIEVKYKSTTTPQHKTISVDANDPSMEGNIFFSNRSTDAFTVQSIIIFGPEGSYTEIERALLPVEEFDIILFRKIAPATFVRSIPVSGKYVVDSVENFQVGYRVRMYDNQTGTFGSDPYREITEVDAVNKTIKVSPAFYDTVTPDRSVIRFADVNNCNANQRSTFIFIS